MKKPFLLMFVWLLAVSAGFGQSPDSSLSEVDRDLEVAFEEFDPENSNIDPEQLTQFLQELAANPVNLNAASLQELLQIPGMTSRIARAIIARRRSKPFESIGELTTISGVGSTTVERFRPYVTIGSQRALTGKLIRSREFWTSRGKVEALTRYQQVIQEQAGFEQPDSTGYAGSQGRYYHRYRYQSDHISLNLTQEKDAGETVDVGAAGFDHSSWHVGINDVGRLQRLVIGDYSVGFGQGLVLWTNGAFGKGRDVTGAPLRRERGVRPYGSAEETRFFRGVAATWGNRLQFTGFYSNRNLSATPIGQDTVGRPSRSGFHRTTTELARRLNTGLQVLGGRVAYNTDYGVVGVTGYSAQFDDIIQPGNAISNINDFSGETTSTVGVDFKLYVLETVLFGEAGRSANGGLGVIGGLQYSLDDQTEITALYRNYADDFQSILGDGFGESTGEPQNETGVYLGLSHRPADRIRLHTYFDQYRFPAPRFGTTRATQGFDWLGLIEADFNRSLNGYLLARHESQDDEFRDLDEFGREFSRLGNRQRSSLRAQLDYQANDAIRLRSRVEGVRTETPDAGEEFGMLVYQDLRWQLNDKLRLDARIMLFDTDSFEARVFQFESDLLYVLSNPSFSGQGQRSYLVLKYSPFRFVDFWMKYDVTVFEDRNTIGSGRDEIQGNVRSRIGLMARVSF